MSNYKYKITPEERIKVKLLLLEGNSYTTVAKLYNVSRERIRQLAWRWDINPLRIRADAKRKLFDKHWNDKWGNRELTAPDLYQAQKEKFTRKKTNATKIGYEWTIVFGDIEWPTHCPVLGLELDYFAEGRQENSVSFDRINPNKGYIPDNVIIVSWRANRIKNDGTAEEHEAIAKFLRNVGIDSQ